MDSFELPLGFEPSSITIPSTFAGIVQGQSPSHPEITNKLVLSQPEPDEIVVRNLGGAINPHDWKFPALSPTPGARVGCDFYGEVIAIGPQAKSRRPDIFIGSYVSGVVFGSNPLQPTSGAFCDYLNAASDLVIVIPQSYLHRDAVALSGAAFLTLSLALWRCLGLAGTLSLPLEAMDPPTHVLVYGASTATGTIALQLLKLSGYSPIAACSPRNFGLVRNRGAEIIVDYQSPTCVEYIKRQTGGCLRYVLDIIADERSRQICVDAIGASGGVCTVLGAGPHDCPTDGKSVHFKYLIAATGFGGPVSLPGPYHRAADPAARLHVGQCFSEIQRFVQRGIVVPHPHLVLSGGYVGAIRGIANLEKGQVRGKKLAYLIPLEE